MRAADGGRRPARIPNPEGAHVDRLGDLEAVLIFAVDDGRGLGHPVWPHQAVTGGGVVERFVAFGAGAWHRVDVAGEPAGPATADGSDGDHSRDQQTTQSGQ